jgi:hypothetical protein
MQLPVCVGLHIWRIEGRCGRRHAVGEGNAGVLPVEPMTRGTVVRERLFSIFDVLFCVGDGICDVLVANREGMFDLGDGSSLPFPGWSGFARPEKNGRGDNQCSTSEHDSIHSTT